MTLPRSDAVLVLVDPFKLTASVWDPIAAALTKMAAACNQVVVEVFTYGGAGRWPAPPAGLCGPVAFVHRGKYHLALYTSRSMQAEVAAVTRQFGWDVTADCPECTRHPDVDAMLRGLAARGYRATYGAAVEYLGRGGARSIMSRHTKDPLHSWIVQKKSGTASGYRTSDIHPHLGGTPVLLTGAQIAAVLAQLAPSEVALGPDEQEG